jgi:thiaminase/transcriptional activator TenA
MYLTWCSTANKSPSSRGYIRDWVTLHAGGEFVQHVAWVRSEIDTRGPTLTEARQTRLSALFEEALEAEIAFHDAPYAD